MHEKVPALLIHGDLALPSLQRLDEAAASLAAASRSAGTQRVYAGAWRDFMGFCDEHGLAPLPASALTVVRYLTHLAGLGRSVATIDLRIAAIALAHRMAGHDSPTVREDVRQVLAGIRNTHGRAPAKKKALTADLLVGVLRKIRGREVAEVRDRAMILLCFGAALRRSELVALNVDDVERHRRGLLVRLPRPLRCRDRHDHPLRPAGSPSLAPAGGSASSTAYLDSRRPRLRSHPCSSAGSHPRRRVREAAATLLATPAITLGDISTKILVLLAS